MSRTEYKIRCPHCYTTKAKVEVPFFGGEFDCENASCPGEDRKFWCTHFPDFDAYVSFAKEMDFFASIARNALELEGLVGNFLICDQEPEQPKGRTLGEELLDMLHGDDDQPEEKEHLSPPEMAAIFAEEYHKRVTRGQDIPKADKAKSISRMATCHDCKGSGKYVGLSKVDTCRTCDGTGEVEVN